MSFQLFRSAVAGLTAVVALAGAAAAAQFTPEQKKEIGSIVKEYLIHNPEVLRDAMVELDHRQKQQAQAAQRTLTADKNSKLYTSSHQSIVGNPDGSATIVEFFDYNCGYCKRALGDLANLMKADPKLKVILKDIPILSQGSMEAAIVEAAVRQQLTGDKFWRFHQKLLLTRGGVGKEEALAVAKSLGADMARLDKDMKDPSIKAGIEETMKLAQSLEVNGTPSYVVGQDVVVGAVGYDDLKTKVGNTHVCGKATC